MIGVPLTQPKTLSVVIFCRPINCITEYVSHEKAPRSMLDQILIYHVMILSTIYRHSANGQRSYLRAYRMTNEEKKPSIQ